MKSASSMVCVYPNLKSDVWPVLHTEKALVPETHTEIVLFYSDESEMEFPGQNDDT